MNVVTILEMIADIHPDRIAVGRQVSYARLRDLSMAGAATLAGAEAVAYVGQSGIGFVTAFFASAWRGVPFVPLNYRLGADKLAQLLARHQNAVAIADEPDQLPGAMSVDTWLAGLDGPVAAPPVPDPAEPALYLYTSGTTAEPKAAILRHAHLCSYVFGSVDFSAAGEEEAALVSVPPYHIAGVANLLSNTFSGRRIVYLPSFDAENWLATARAEAVTQAMVVPTMLARVVAQGAVDLPALRLISYGGAPMPEPVLRRALKLFPNVGFVNAYGLTETSSSIAVLGPADHREALTATDPAVARRLGSVGRLLPGIEVQIRGGEIWVRGGQISGEYAGTGSACDENGWFPTRDRGWLDDAGYLFVEGRADDTIIRGGENIAPAEVEDVLMRHPDVLDAAVVGLPDQEWGQRVAAAVTVRPDATVGGAELAAWTRRHLRSSRAADVVVVRDELPRTDTGKLLRRTIAADLVKSVTGSAGR